MTLTVRILNILTSSNLGENMWRNDSACIVFLQCLRNGDQIMCSVVPFRRFLRTVGFSQHPIQKLACSKHKALTTTLQNSLREVWIDPCPLPSVSSKHESLTIMDFISRNLIWRSIASINGGHRGLRPFPKLKSCPIMSSEIAPRFVQILPRFGRGRA